MVYGGPGAGACLRGTLLAYGLLLAAPAVHTQSPPPASDSTQPTFRTGIDLVRVDVTVTARGDVPVRDLTVDDFEVREDGVLQRIQSAQFVELSGHPPPGDDLSLDIRSPEHAAQEAAREDVRLLVIFLDDYHLRCGAVFDHQLKQLLRRFVRTEMRPTDLLAVMGPMTPISDLGLTRSREAILERINRLEGRLGCFVRPRSVLEENQFTRGTDMARIRAQISFSALQSLAVHLGGLREGRKSVLFISEGPPVIANRLHLFDHLQDVIAAANTNNVTIHTMDPRELGASSDASTANVSLAAETGGRRLAQSNDHSRALRAVMADASAYYLLGYSPDRQHSDGKFHKIDVKVRRKGVRALARHGYWAPRPEELLSAAPVRPRPPAEITEVLTSLALDERPRLARDSIAIGPLEDGGSLVTIACEAETDGPRALQIGGFTAELLSEDGGVTETFVASHLEADGRWITRFRATPGLRQVRLTVVDASGETLDTWKRKLHVPVAGDASAHLGTPVVYRPRTPAEYRALKSGADGPPAIDRHFRHADRVLVRLPLSTGSESLEVRAELVNGHGQTLMALPVERRAGGTPQIELPVSSLGHSAYVLRLTATVDGVATSRLLPFAVVP